MGLTPNVVPDAPILSAWGNEVRDRSIQVFATAAERSGAWPTPPEGAHSYLTATDSVYLYNGSAWIWVAGTALYAARMYRSTNVNAPVATSAIPYDTASYDYNTNLTLGAGAQYTVPVTGLYDVRAGSVFLLANNPQNAFLAMVRNPGAVELTRGSQAVVRGGLATDAWSFNLVDTVALTAGDTIQATFNNGGGNVVSLQGGPALNYFAIRKV